MSLVCAARVSFPIKDFRHRSIRSCLKRLGYKVGEQQNAYTYRKAQSVPETGSINCTVDISQQAPRPLAVPDATSLFSVIAIILVAVVMRFPLMAGQGQPWVSQQGSETLTVTYNRRSLRPALLSSSIRPLLVKQPQRVLN